MIELFIKSIWHVFSRQLPWTRLIAHGRRGEAEVLASLLIRWSRFRCCEFREERERERLHLESVPLNGGRASRCFRQRMCRGLLNSEMMHLSLRILLQEKNATYSDIVPVFMRKRNCVVFNEDIHWTRTNFIVFDMWDIIMSYLNKRDFLIVIRYIIFPIECLIA